MTTMKITAIAPWFGGKRTLAPTIVSELGPHESYFEPFCGSMAVLFAKEPSRQETVCDLHGHLTNLAWVLQDDKKAVQLYDRLTRTLFCEAMLEHAKTVLQGESLDPLNRAYWFFIHSWCARNGTSGSRRTSFQIAVRWTSGGGSPTTRFRNAIESIPAWHERIRNVVILNRDAFKIIPSVPDEPGVAIYCDQPYLHSTRTGDGGYLHDFQEFIAASLSDEEDQDEHTRLAESLHRFRRTRVVVSYYDHPTLSELYPGWTQRKIVVNKALAVQGQRGGKAKKAVEVLLVNGPSYANPETKSLFQ